MTLPVNIYRYIQRVAVLMNRERRYITLHPRYQLRGWRDRPYALYDWEAWGGEYKKILPLTKAQFSGIELATMPGVSIDDALFPAPLKQAAEKLISAGIFIERDRDAGLSDFQKYRFADTRMTHELVWSITGKCNLRCRHCYINGGEGAYGEFTFRECEDIVRQMTEAGIYMVAITGGEPLVRRDFWQLIELMKENRINIEEIFTNGMLVTEEFLDRLESLHIGLNCFLLSFDGVGWHDWMRGVKGTEERVIRAIRLLRERGYGVIVSTVAHKDNLASLPATYELMKKLNVTDWKIGPVVNSGSWKKNENTELSQHVFYEMCLNILQMWKDDGMPMRMKLGGLFESQGRGAKKYTMPGRSGARDANENSLLCEAIRAFPQLLPNGKLLTCFPMTGTFLEKIAPNVLEEGWSISRALLESPVEEYTKATYGDLFRENKTCGACEHRLVYTHCPADGLNAGGSIFAVDGSGCVLSKGNYEEKVRAIMGEEFIFSR